MNLLKYVLLFTAGVFITTGVLANNTTELLSEQKTDSLSENNKISAVQAISLFKFTVIETGSADTLNLDKIDKNRKYQLTQ